MFVVATVYLIYWGNIQYLTENWSQFNQGRLMGPRDLGGTSIYNDENAFAMFFVTGLPFVYYMAFEVSREKLRYVIWAIIPFGLHAIFLTGSRGGLLGLLTIIVLIILMSKRRLMALPVLFLFFLFYQFQAGSVMKDRGQQISEFEGESSAEARLTAWKGGYKMIMSHPITGVGLGAFMTATPKFIDATPRVAHNTFVQYTAESGIGAGLCFLMVVVLVYSNFQKVRIWCRENKDNEESHSLSNYNSASFISFAGFIVTSLFLSLNNYEVFNFLLVINNTLAVYCTQATTHE